jgi:hypothetical protein
MGNYQATIIHVLYTGLKMTRIQGQNKLPSNNWSQKSVLSVTANIAIHCQSNSNCLQM